MGSYTLHRDNRGHARFYCNQHVGKERQSLKRGLGDAVDNSSAGSSRPTSMLYDSTPSASNSSHDEVNINEVITEESCKFVHSCVLNFFQKYTNIAVPWSHINYSFFFTFMLCVDKNFSV